MDPFRRDFTYIDNVTQANHLASVVQNKAALNQVYNVALWWTNFANQLFFFIRKLAAGYDKDILTIEPIYGPVREGDIPHSLASIEKAKKLLYYSPAFNVEEGLREAVKWYWKICNICYNMYWKNQIVRHIQVSVM